MAPAKDRVVPAMTATTHAYTLSTYAIGLLLAGPAAQAQQWQNRLQGGGDVRVDVSTNRATVTENGVTVPLWDGVHRLEDGSSLTVRSGIVVPNEGILDARHPPPPEEQAVAPPPGQAVSTQYTTCVRLVYKVCGAQDQCLAHPGCSPSKQLLAMEREEMKQSQYSTSMTYTSWKCDEALRDEAFFTPCAEKSAQ